MIVLDKKKPISALKLIHTLNHTRVNRLCDINSSHIRSIKTLNYTIGERIYNLQAGLYKIIINEVEYIIDVYFCLSDADYLIINNEYDIAIYMASNIRYNVIPYKINNIINDTLNHSIETINDNIDAIMITGNTKYLGMPYLDNPVSIDRISSVQIKTESEIGNDLLNIPFKHTLGKLPNGVKDTIIINADQLIAHDIINTSKEVLSGGLDWKFVQECSDEYYYVFFAKYDNVKNNNSSNSIRCSHFESVACEELINANTRKNCIAVSNETYTNGIWIKISNDALNTDKDFSKAFKQWIISYAVSENPIYIEYQITNTIYNTILIDEYHIKTWYHNTMVNMDNYFSIFYKNI